MTRLSTTVSCSLALSLAIGLAIGSGGAWRQRGGLEAAEPSSDDNRANFDLLKAEVERLKGLVPDQAHAMADVGYHFANLWFAGQNDNWPLAQFYLNETRSHLKWAVRIIPVRKLANGQELPMAPILEAMDTGPLSRLDHEIKEKDKEGFVTAYQTTLTSCYGCHTASEKTFIQLQIPARPDASIVRFEP